MKLARAALRGRGPRVAGAGAVLAALALAATVRAESARRVVLVVPEAPGAVATEALARVRGELGAARFEVETDTSPTTSIGARRSSGRSGKADARAAFGIFFGSGVAEIWVSDSVSGRTVVQTLPLSTAAPERRAAVLAVKAVDLLKATLAEVWVASPTAPAPTPAAPPAPTPTVASPASSPSAPPPSLPPPSPAPQVDLTETAARPSRWWSEMTPGARAQPPAAPPGRGVDLAAGIGWIGAGSVEQPGGRVRRFGLSGTSGGACLRRGSDCRRH